LRHGYRSTQHVEILKREVGGFSEPKPGVGTEECQRSVTGLNHVDQLGNLSRREETHFQMGDCGQLHASVGISGDEVRAHCFLEHSTGELRCLPHCGWGASDSHQLGHPSLKIDWPDPLKT
jgi:hypothetical protein